MKDIIRIGDVIQFTENHPWCGCLGIVTERRTQENNHLYTIEIPIPGRDPVRITAIESNYTFARIGTSALLMRKEDKNDQDNSPAG